MEPAAGPQPAASQPEASPPKGGSATHHHQHGDVAPGEEHTTGNGVAMGLKGYTVGLGLAAILTVLSFSMPGNSLVWGPAIPAALIIFAIAQMGVHLVFFLHITTEPDHTNNIMALAFGLVIVTLLIGGSLWIMTHLDHNMMPMEQMMQMQR
jgi:cytochrome o ubiquinol oxidase operon protein cyoD